MKILAATLGALIVVGVSALLAGFTVDSESVAVDTIVDSHLTRAAERISTLDKAVTEALDYWLTEDGEESTVGLQFVRITWTTDVTCEGQGGCALIGGCAAFPLVPLDLDNCRMWIFGKGLEIWGYDWIVGVLKHEMGHLLGYSHGDPTCTMNSAYCQSAQLGVVA